MQKKGCREVERITIKEYHLEKAYFLNRGKMLQKASGVHITMNPKWTPKSGVGIVHKCQELRLTSKPKSFSNPTPKYTNWSKSPTLFPTLSPSPFKPNPTKHELKPNWKAQVRFEMKLSSSALSSCSIPRSFTSSLRMSRVLFEPNSTCFLKRFATIQEICLF